MALEAAIGEATRLAMRRTRRRRALRSLSLTAPLLIFLVVIFLIPIASLLTRAVDNQEIARALPHTLTALQQWDRQSDLPPAPAFDALAEDLINIKKTPLTGALARRLNYEISGYRSLIFKTQRKLPKAMAEVQDAQALLQETDKHWSESRYWHAIARNDKGWTPYYLLASLDMKLDDAGKVVSVPEGTSAFRAIFARTFVISFVVTLITLLLGYPLAYWITTLSKRRANLVLICVLIPFWTSILVRIAAWVVLLQRQGLINTALTSSGILDQPADLLFNRTGVYIGMVHILLPFMILPLYSVMRGVPASYQRAAVSLGSHPFGAFWKVYVPQTYAGVGAGSLLVFIIAVGYYITPALLGGAADQMISYYVAYFTDTTVNWGMASALGLILLAGTLVLYWLYNRLSGKQLSLG